MKIKVTIEDVTVEVDSIRKDFMDNTIILTLKFAVAKAKELYAEKYKIKPNNP